MNESTLTPVNYGTTDTSWIYAYLVLAFIAAGYLVWKSPSRFRLELFVLAFYLMSGNVNELLTFRIPGISFFEIQPDRFLFLFFSFFLVRQVLFSSNRSRIKSSATIPWFLIMLYLFIIMIIISQFSYLDEFGAGEIFVELAYALNILVLIYSLKLLLDEETLRILGKAIIFGAIASSLISFIQLGIDPMFMRQGDQGIAFGSVLRSNGIFNNEYCNAYFLIIALAWTIVTVDKKKLRYLLIALFTLGVICSFQRMSWVILSLILAIYFLKIERVALDKLIIAGLLLVCVALTTLLVFQREIMNSGLVKERLSEVPTGRIGYYTMVVDNIWKKPFLGYGGKNNELYYYSMLLITDNRKRATGEEGDIHSGYFSALFYYGIPALIFFIGFVVLSVAYFGQRTQYHKFFVIPFLLGLLYAIGNLTNTLLFSQYLSVLYALHLGLGLGLKASLFSGYQKKYISAPPLTVKAGLQ